MEGVCVFMSSPRNMNIYKWSLLSAALLLNACAKETFEVTTSTSAQSSPGGFTVAPKVDILFVQDDTGSSLSSTFVSLKSQTSTFLSDLDSKKWDYHFATAPLTLLRTDPSQVVASKYDSARGSSWVPAYPGAQPESFVSPQAFRTPESFTQLIIQGTNALNGMEPGFNNIVNALKTTFTGTGFIRNDAILAIVYFGNGNDTSGFTACFREDGRPDVCPGPSSSVSYHHDQIAAIKGNASLIKFYAARAPITSPCYEQSRSNALNVNRYEQMAYSFGGQAYDICSQSIVQVLSGIESQLETIKGSNTTRYLFTDREPNPSTIRVLRYVGGDTTHSVEIPQSDVNGWTFAGFVTNVFAIDSPIPLNLSSGWAIELHGTAKITGSDTSEVIFAPAGAHNSN